MIKNIFFDLDNTIIKDELDDSKYYKEVLTILGFDESNYMKIYNLIDEYEVLFNEENNYFNKKELLDFINYHLEQNYPIELIDEISKAIGKYWIKEVYLKEEIIKKLYSKYNLYVYTNYFEDAQSMRIKNIGYDKYFKKIFAADKFGCKPYKSSFKRVLDYLKAKPEECIMIGDSISKDILAANNIGMKSILFDYDGKRDNKSLNLKDYIVINNMDDVIEELEKIEKR